MRRFSAVMLSCVVGCGSLPAFGQSDVIKPGEERLTIGLGWVFNSFGTDLRVDDASLGEGTNVSLSDFGVNKNASSFWATFEWRFAARHRIGFNSSYFKLSGTRTATRQIQIGDEIYPAGATVDVEFKIQIIPVTYSYSFLKTDRNELAAMAGVHWSRIDLSAHGTASLSSEDANADVTAKVEAPLPLIGLRYDHHFSQRWSASLQAGYFRLKFGKDSKSTEGELRSARAEAEYRFSRHFGLGLAIEGFEIDAESGDDSWRGTINYRYWGPQLYLKARF